MTDRWGTIVVVLLALFCIPLVGLASDSWTQLYEHEDEVRIGTVLEMADEYWLIGTNVSSVEPPDTGIVAFRIQPDGRLIAPMSYDWEGVQSAADALITDEGDVLFVGRTDQYGVVGSDMYVLRTDGSGQTLSEWVFGDSLDESATRIVLGSQGDYFIVGNQLNPEDAIADVETPGYGGFESRSAPYVARVQTNGVVVWKNHYRSTANVVVVDAVPSRTGGCFVLGTVYGFPDEQDAIHLIRLDENGTVMWSRTFDEGDSKGYALIPLSRGRLVIAGSRAPSDDTGDGNAQALLILVEEFGREVWSRTYGDADKISSLQALVETGDELVVAAGTQYSDAATHRDNVYLLCVDADGELQWEQSYATDKHVTIEALRESEAGGFLIAGDGAGEGERFQAMLMQVNPQAGAEAP